MRHRRSVGFVLAAAGCSAALYGAAGAASRSEAPRPVPVSGPPPELAAACAARRPVVVLDPGHSGGPNFDSTAEVDSPRPVTGLGIRFHPVDIDGSGIMSIDNGGAPGERITMWRAALRIRMILRSAGYAVDLTKSSANEDVGLLERVREAIADHATIAVSLHYTGGVRFGEPNAHFGVTPQQVGRYRTNVANGHTIRFRNARVAAESQRDARIIQKARAAAGDRVDVAPLDESFPKSRGLPAYGNISIVQVVDQRFPWIYNEDGDIGFNLRAYSTGIANGIKRAVPIAACLAPHR
jgi:N-acetylmuramoyl-L-alanine amidase